MSSYRDTSSFYAPRLSFDDLTYRIATRQSMRRTNLMGVDFDAIDAPVDGIDYTEACLIGSSFERVILNNTNFRGADLTNANLVMASLTGADLREANLRGVNLAFADLSGADMVGPPFRSSGYTFTEMLLWQTVFPNGTRFPGPFLTTGYAEDFPKEFW